MTKQKKTLRAAILASIFAMSVCGSAWADIWGEDLDGNKFDSDAYNNDSGGGTGGLPDYTEFVPPEVESNRDNDDWWEKISAYNPTLQSSNGEATVNGTVVESPGKFGNGKFSPEYNYFFTVLCLWSQ